MNSWWIVFGIILFAAIVVSSAVVTVYFVLFSSKNVSTEVSNVTKYSCGNDGTCSEDVDGSFNTLGDCTNYCDRASCLSSGVCVANPGNLDLGTMSECEESCKDKRFSCTQQGCIDVGTGNGTYDSMTNCIANCTTWDVDDDGYCTEVPLTSNGEAIYENQSQCESAEYTSTCDMSNSECTPDNKRVEGNNLVDDCSSNCNPNYYTQCSSDWPNTDGYDAIAACDGKEEQDSCSVAMTSPSSMAGTLFYGKCSYCIKDDEVQTPLSCQCWDYLSELEDSCNSTNFGYYRFV